MRRRESHDQYAGRITPDKEFCQREFATPTNFIVAQGTRLPRHPKIKEIMNSTMNITNRSLAMPADAAAIPPNPKTAATSAMIRNTTAHPNIRSPPHRLNRICRLGRVPLRWSDGSGAVAEMADAAANRSYEYIAITDHSKTLKIAGGIDERALNRQGVEIANVNAALSKSAAHVTVLRSTEMNLNPRGEGDMSPDSLRSLDLVLGSFHSALRTIEDQTERYLAALRNPQIHILGHPRGRIYNFRIGLKADWPRVFAGAARLEKALEIDCYPDRQDLNLELLKIARDHGTHISLGTDAHDGWQLEFIDLGLAAALRAKIPAERILNFMPILELKTSAKCVRDRTRSRR